MTYTDEERAFLVEHVWAVLATGRTNGAPQQSMVGYTLDEQGRLLISTRRPSAKWHNITRTPTVSLTVADGRVNLVVYGRAELIDTDPERAELSADILAVVRGPDRPDPSTIVGWLDQDQRGVVRITTEKVFFHE
jgi:PPOX class probable F420-dependent enzyme